MSLLEEHFREHPEEYEQILMYRKVSEAVEADLQRRRQEKLKVIEECRRELNAKHSV